MRNEIQKAVPVEKHFGSTSKVRVNLLSIEMIEAKIEEDKRHALFKLFLNGICHIISDPEILEAS